MIPLKDWLEALPDDPWKRPSRFGYLVVPDGKQPSLCQVNGDELLLLLHSVLQRVAIVSEDGEERRVVLISDVRVPSKPRLVFQQENGTRWLPAGASLGWRGK